MQHPRSLSITLVREGQEMLNAGLKGSAEWFSTCRRLFLLRLIALFVNRMRWRRRTLRQARALHEVRSPHR